MKKKIHLTVSRYEHFSRTLEGCCLFLDFCFFSLNCDSDTLWKIVKLFSKVKTTTAIRLRKNNKFLKLLLKFRLVCSLSQFIECSFLKLKCTYSVDQSHDSLCQVIFIIIRFFWQKKTFWKKTILHDKVQLLLLPFSAFLSLFVTNKTQKTYFSIVIITRSTH